ncbi:WGR domain-containing protein [Vibrio nigripulchritudo]|uniref:WGR domain-containing protein n=1 Tax=Vibrio nigripulchritudo TaxID=28173 RepID=UPI0003B22F3A|nr:WGR domain-containing protein [Vibrio nigripulchritudo]CCN72167.1 conserved hypothetical protein containing WGR domain [Vibrio nigripulchritudo SFn118]
MKLIRKSRLRYQKDNSDKVYEVDLVEQASSDPNRYLVNFRYGRRGSRLREGTKTREPVALEQAERLFDSVVVSKINKGYEDLNALSAYTSSNEESEGNLFDHASLIERIENEKDSYALGRQIWRLRPVANPDLAALISSKLGSKVWQLDYAILWSLGRIGSQSDINTIKPYLSHADAKFSALAMEAILSLTPKSERAQTYRDLSGHALLEAEEFTRKVDQFVAQTTPDTNINSLLKQAYLQSWFDESIQKALQQSLPRIPFVPNAFQGIRYILKMSEFRLDATTFAIAQFQLEQRNPFFQKSWRYYYSHQHGRLEVEKELKSPEARLAHSQNTHNYLVRRQWRVLKQLGVNESPDYVRMATQILLQFKDSDGKKPKTSEIYEYDSNWRRQLKSVNHYDGFARYATFNAILRKEHPAYARSEAGYVWKFNPDVTFEGRGEAFSQLWDQVPHNLLELALASECQPVCEFAIRALQDNTSYIEALSLDILVNLMVRPYSVCQQFAKPLIDTQLERHRLSGEQLVLLLESGIEAAQSLALEQLDKIADLSKTADVLVALLTMESVIVKDWLDEKMQRNGLFRSGQAEVLNLLTQRLISHPLRSIEQALWLAEWLKSHCKDALSGLSLTQIEALVLSEYAPNTLLGCELLMSLDVAWSDIPTAIFDAIQASDSYHIQSFSVALLSKQSPDELVENLPYLLTLLLKNNEAQRKAVLTALPAAYQRNNDNRGLVFGKLVALLNQRELDQDLQRLVTDFIQQEFERELSIKSLNEVLLLATAKSEMAHNVVLPILSDSFNGRTLDRELDNKSWLLLANSNTFALREIARAHFEREPKSLLDYSEEFLALLASAWLDTKEFAFEFSREHMTAEHWNPEAIVSVCDNPDGQVQAFGRELLQRFFDETDGKQYLLKLSQHPAANVELFVTQFLSQYASGDESILLALKPYFISVLSRVNSGRVAKDRVLAFMTEQATASPKVMEMVSEILTRQSLTSVHKDKAQILKAMLALKQQESSLAMPIEIKSPRHVASSVAAIMENES